jgi:hypothetical protein
VGAGVLQSRLRGGEGGIRTLSASPIVSPYCTGEVKSGSRNIPFLIAKDSPEWIRKSRTLDGIPEKNG